jgi:amidase
MARSVRDAALLLTAMAAEDPADPAARDHPASVPDYAAGLSVDALRGKRIGVLRTYSGAGSDQRIQKILGDSIDTLKSGGAEIVDPIQIDTEGMDDAEFEVLLYEFKADLNDYLMSSDAPMQSLEAVIEFNTANADSVMPFFGQDIMESAQRKGPLTDAAYLKALTSSKRIARGAIDGAMQKHDLDALIAPSNGPAWLTDHVNGDHFSIGSSSLAAVSGYPNVTVPAGHISGLPVGVSFFGAAFSEKALLEIAHAFEHASQARKPPLSR